MALVIHANRVPSWRRLKSQFHRQIPGADDKSPKTGWRNLSPRPARKTAAVGKKFRKKSFSPDSFLERPTANLQLPTPSLEEKKAYVAKKAEARKNLQIALREVGKLRSEFVKKKLEEIASEQGKTVQAAMIEILTSQLKAKGFELE